MSTTVTYQVSTGARGPAGSAAEVTSTNVLAALQGEVLEVVSVALSDGTGTMLESGALTLNANNQIVVHDNESNAEDLPYVVDSRRSLSFATRAPFTSTTSFTPYSVLLADIPLKSAEVADGKFLHIFGEIRSIWDSGTKPDGGAIMVLCKEGQDPLSDGFLFSLAEAGSSEVKSFHFLLDFSVTAGTWTASNSLTQAIAIAQSNTSGTVTSAPAWANSAGITENSAITGTDGDPAKLQLYLVTINDAATVTANLIVSGNLSVISQ